jgi:hypothetical protein
MKRLLLSLCLLVVLIKAKAQESVSIGTDQTKATAILWLNGNGSQGLLLPIANTAAFSPSPAEAGLMVYNSVTKKVMYWDGATWIAVGGSGTDAQQLSKNGNDILLTGSVNIKIAETTPTQSGQLLVWNGTAWTTSSSTIPANGQVLKFNGTTWAPAADDTGSGTTPTLTNGQILTGNGTSNAATTLSGDATLTGGTLTIANGAVTSAKITDGTITGTDIASGTVTSANIADGTVTSTDIANGTIAATDLATMSATNGQVLKFNGTAWAPATDDAGSGSVPTLSNGQILTGNGTTNAATALSGDATLTGGVLTIAANAIGSSEITDGSVAAADLNAMSATNGQVLKFNGTAWAPGSDDAGTGSVPTLSNGQILTGNGTTNAATALSGDATLTGGVLTIAANAIGSSEITDGSVAAADLNTMSATNGQVLQYNGTNWAPATVSSGATTLDGLTDATVTSPVSTQVLVHDGAGQFRNRTLSGDATINNTGTVTIANNAVGSAEITDASIVNADLGTGAVNSTTIADGTVTSTDISDGTITSIDIADGTITSGDIASETITSSNILNGTIAATDLATMSATNGQVLKFNGTNWAPAADDAGVGATPTLSNGQILVGDGTTNVATLLSGDVTLSAGTITINNGAITSAKILDGSVTTTDIADGTVDAGDLATMGAVNGQLLQYNGSAWAPATISTGATTVDGLTDATVTTPTSAQVLVHDGAGQFRNRSLSGDATISNTGVVTIGTGAVGSAEIINASITGTDIAAETIASGNILNGTITGTDIAGGTVTSSNITDGTIAAVDLATMSATNGQVLKFDGTSWAPAADNTGAVAPVLSNGQIMTGNGTTNAATVLSGDATLNAGVITIGTGAITSTKISDGTITGTDIASNTVASSHIVDGTITGTDIADGTIDAADLGSMSATAGQVLEYDGTNWNPTTPTTGVTTLDGLTDATVAAATSAQVLVNDGAGQFRNRSLSGDATISNTGVVTISTNAVGSTEITDGSVATADLTTTGVTANTYGNATNVAQFTVDAAGRITGASNVAISTGATTLDGLTDATVTTPSSAQILINDGAGQFQNRSVSGDATISSTGVMTISSNAIGSAEITDGSIAIGDLATGSVNSTTIADGTVTSIDIADGTVAAADLASMSATSGQVLKFNGTSWAPGADNTGGGGGGGGGSVTLNNGEILIGDGTANAAAVLTGDATLTGGILTISNDAITSVKVLDGSLRGDDINDGSIEGADLSTMSATNGQVLTFNGTNWAPATPTTGSTTLDGLTDATVATPAAGHVLINDGAGQFQNRALSGDATVNATGTVTIASNAIGSAEITNASITGTDIAATTITAGNITDATITSAKMTTTGVTSGTYGNATNIPQFTVDAQGRVTGASNIALSTGATTLDGLTDATVTTPAAGHVLINDGAGQFQNRALSGDATVNSTGTVTIASNAIGSAEISDGTVASADITNATITSTDIASETITSSNILNGTIAAADLSSMSATAGQVLQYNSGVWTPSTLTLGATTIDGLTDATVTTPASGQILINDGAGQFQNRTVSGDIAINNLGVTTIADNSVTNQKISGVGLGKLLQGGATNGQTLSWNGTAWTPTSLTSAASPALYAIRGNSAGTAQEASAIYDDGTFTGIGLTSGISGADRFSINADYGAGAWGGMYINTNATGLPFYGYAKGGAALAYTYLDASGHWRLYNNGDRFVVQSNGIVGINTVAPNNSILHLEGGTTTYNAIHMTHSGSGSNANDGFLIGPYSTNSNDLILWNFETGSLRFGTASNERMTINSSGNVGLGTTSPSTQLHVYGGTGAGGGAYSSLVRGVIEDDGQTFFEINGSTWSGFTFNDDSQSLRAGMFFNTTSDYLQFKTGGTDSRLVITEDGNVGVNITTPSALLDVNNGVSGTLGEGFRVTNNYTGASTKYGIRSTVSNGGTGLRYGVYSTANAAAGNANSLFGMASLVTHDGSGATYGYYADVNKSASQAGSLYGLYVISDNDGTGNSYLMYANSVGSTTGTEYGVYVTGEDQNSFSGKLGIGTTTPEAELHVRHTNGFPNHGIRITDTFNSADVDLYVSATDGALWLGLGGSHLGTFSATTGAYTTVSDRRMKRDIESVGTVLDKVLKLNPVQYYFTTEKNPANKNLGFIAQDVQSIFPSLVSHSKEDDRFSLDYTGFGVIAIKAIQEQNEVITEQKSEIEKLRGELDALKGQVEEIKKLLEKK